MAAASGSVAWKSDDSLTAATGYVVAEQGASFDVSGAESDAVSFRSGRMITAPRRIASAGGSIDIRAREGLLIGGNAQRQGRRVQAHKAVRCRYRWIGKI